MIDADWVRTLTLHFSINKHVNFNHYVIWPKKKYYQLFVLILVKLLIILFLSLLISQLIYSVYIVYRNLAKMFRREILTIQILTHIIFNWLKFISVPPNHIGPYKFKLMWILTKQIVCGKLCIRLYLVNISHVSDIIISSKNEVCLALSS